MNFFEENTLILRIITFQKFCNLQHLFCAHHFKLLQSRIKVTLSHLVKPHVFSIGILMEGIPSRIGEEFYFQCHFPSLVFLTRIPIGIIEEFRNAIVNSISEVIRILHDSFRKAADHLILVKKTVDFSY